MNESMELTPICVKNLSCRYHRDKPVLDNISFTLGAGEIITLLGVNGVGKSTLMKAIARLIPRDGGEIAAFGRDINEYSVKEFARLVSYVGQNDADCCLSLFEYVLMGRNPYLGATAKAHSADAALCIECIRRMDLSTYAEVPVARLSGGERKRAKLARALAKNTPVLLLDEPLTSLDLNHERDILQIIRGLAAEGRSIVMSTHNPAHTFLLKCKTLVIRRDGSAVSGAYDDKEIIDTIRSTYEASLTITNSINGFICHPKALEPQEVANL